MGAKFLKQAKPVLEEDVKTLRQSVEDILERVRNEGDAALAHYSKTFDQFEGAIRVSEEEAAAAKDELPEDIIKGLDFAIAQVTAFAEAQRSQISEFEREIIPGVHMGHRLVPVDSCAAYVPAGRYPCLTSAVMSLAPAKVAGVKRIVACSSPGKERALQILRQQGLLQARKNASTRPSFIPCGPSEPMRYTVWEEPRPSPPWPMELRPLIRWT